MGSGGGDCVSGINSYDGQVLDLGSPAGGPGPYRNPVPFMNMNQLYKNHNVVYTQDTVYIIPARDNIAVWGRGGGAQVFPMCGNSAPRPVRLLVSTKIVLADAMHSP
ncbi:MAG: hypothetical protein WA364_22340 [Candidatus Nitrosopolaris sp.]